MPRLNKNFIDKLNPSTKDLVYFDDALPGFGVRAKPSGVISYFIQYRNAYGRSRRFTIGKHGVFTAEEARAEARRRLADVTRGHDPAQERQELRQSINVSDLCDAYLEKGAGHKKPSTLATDKGRIERHIKPLIGKRPVRALTRADVRHMMQAIADGKTAVDEKTKARGRAIVTGGKGTATKAVSLLGTILSYAIDQGIRPDNPAHGVQTFAYQKRDRFLSASELAELGKALTKLEGGENAQKSAIAIVRLLLLTGCRKSEIARLRWSEIDRDRRCLRLADAKTGARLVGLGQPALDLLEELPRFKDSSYVFRAARGEGHYMGTDKIWRSTIRSAAEIDNVRLHDLRHTFASVGAELGYSQPTIGALLGHSGAGVTGRYIHFGRDPLGAAADHISKTIAARLEGGAEIVVLPEKSA